MLRKAILLITATLMSGMIYAQLPERPGPDSNKIPSFRMDQHRAWLSKNYAFPAKERTRWQVGLSGGMLRLSSDVKSEFGSGFGVHIRKSLGYAFSIRAQYVMGTAYGLNWNQSTSAINNPALNGGYSGLGFQNNLDYTVTDGNGTKGSIIHHNYQAKMRDVSIQAIFNLNNIKFHKEKNFVSLYALAGAGALAYKTFMNHENQNGVQYDYQSGIQGLNAAVPSEPNDIRNRVGNRDVLKGVLDETYESRAEVGPGLVKLGDADVDPWVVAPSFSIGFGVAFRLANWLEVAVEHRVSITDDDLIDGQRFQEPEEVYNNFSNLTPNDDNYHYTSLSLNFNLLKNAQEPDWWKNPLYYPYANLEYLEEKTDFADDDGDGVPNILDREPNSPKGAVVTPDGRAKDSDGDGYLDHEDPEPFSTNFYPIVDGQTQWPESVSEERVLELIAKNSITNWWLPIIHFDLDKDYIRRPDFENMAHVANVMQNNPDIILEVIGHTDIRNTDDYNVDLSRRRSENAVKYLVDKYGIDKNRLVIKYLGETQTFIEAKNEQEHFLNRRVEFRVQK